VVRDRGLAPKVVIDLGETWNFAYYTGVMFQILAEGPGAAVGSGGRYDGLLTRFGVPRAAAGFAVDLDNLGWALTTAGVRVAEPARILVSGSSDALIDALRRAGVRCAPAPEADPRAYAEAWRYSHLLEVQKHEVVLVSIAGGSRTKLDLGDQTELVSRLLTLLG